LISACVLTTTAAVVVAAPASNASACIYETFLMGRDGYSVYAQREFVCGEDAKPVTTTILRNGYVVASGSGSALYRCYGEGAYAKFQLLYTTLYKWVRCV
jgi:hypothetical protein